MVTYDHGKLLLTALKFLRVTLLTALPVVGYLLWASWPVPPAPTGKPIESPSFTVASATAHDLDWYAPLWQRDLKMPPIPPTTAEPGPETTKPQGPVPTLLATFVEKNGRYAHLQDHTGRIQFTSIHDDVDRFEVVAIEPGRVKLKSGDRRVWVEMPESPDR